MKAFRYLLAIFGFLAFFSLGQAYAKDNLTQAKEFIKAGMYPQATAVLEKEIYGDEKAKVKANPTNAEAQFLLGICYANQGRYNDADERFASTIKLKPNYGYKIGGAYKDAGLSSLDNGNIGNAEALFQKAIKYQPNLRRAIATDLLEWGKGNNNGHLLSLAVNYNSELRENVANHYYDLSKSISGEDGLIALKNADKYSGGFYKAEVGIKALEVCDSKLRPEERKSCIDRNSTYLDVNQIFESSVRYFTKLWGPPTKVVKLEGDSPEIVWVNPKNGEWLLYLSPNEFLIGDDIGTPTKWKASISEDYGFEYKGGRGPVKFWRGEKATIVYVWIKK